MYLLDLCYKYDIPLIYASSAATYGDGKKGFNDNIPPSKLKPLNIYAKTKNMFDKHILNTKTKKPSHWIGFKFFNVYGQGEEHKKDMASIIYKGYQEIIKTGQIKLFKSLNNKYKDGEQKRDFIHVDDICDVIIWSAMRIVSTRNYF